MRNDGTDGSAIGLLAKPQLNLQSAVLSRASQEDVDVQVLEGTSEGTTRASNLHSAGLHLNGDYRKELYEMKYKWQDYYLIIIIESNNIPPLGIFRELEVKRVFIVISKG